MIHFDDFFRHIEATSLKPFSNTLRTTLNARYCQHLHGDHPRWQAGFDALPRLDVHRYQLHQPIVGTDGTALNPEATAAFREALMALHPWRKGPFRLNNTFIDTEWRSDWKWQRIAPAIKPLTGKYVLDVGCGSGYHCWRMRGAGARLVLGIDPSQKFLFQFHTLKKYIGPEPVFFLPFRSDDMPRNNQCFDTVFSLGVLYHRPSPFDHLHELKQNLKPGGQLVLETLTVNGGENTVLVPPGRYAKMPNVWFLPSPATLCQWLQRAGFVKADVVDINITSTAEQRRTDWMRFHSLAQFLDPQDRRKTCEGLPAPMRTTVVADKPE